MVDGTELAEATAEGGPRADPLARVRVSLANRAATEVDRNDAQPSADAEVATRWGAEPTAGGKIVWFEVAV